MSDGLDLNYGRAIEFWAVSLPRGLPERARFEILGAPEPPLEPLSKKYGAQGGALGRPEIASEALEAILENVKKTLVFTLF